MSSVKSPHSPQGSGGGIFIFLIALGIIQMDIGGCADCRCRLDDKFSFRSTPGAMFCFVPSVMSPLLVSEWKKSTLIVINYSRFVCWWLASSWRLLKILRHLWLLLGWFFRRLGKWGLIVAIVWCRFLLNAMTAPSVIDGLPLWPQLGYNFCGAV